LGRSAAQPYWKLVVSGRWVDRMQHPERQVTETGTTG